MGKCTRMSRFGVERLVCRILRSFGCFGGFVELPFFLLAVDIKLCTADSFFYIFFFRSRFNVLP